MSSQQKKFRGMTAKELVGRKVRVVNEFKNKGGDVFKKGRVLEVVDKWGGLSLRSLRRDNGRFLHCSRVGYHYLELLPVGQ